MAYHETSQSLASILAGLGGLVVLLSALGGIVGGLLAMETNDMLLFATLAGGGLMGVVTGLAVMALGSMLRYLEELRDHLLPTDVQGLSKTAESLH